VLKNVKAFTRDELDLVLVNFNTLVTLIMFITCTVNSQWSDIIAALKLN